MTDDMKTKLSLPSDEEMLITRTFDAPRDLVWQMWASCEHLKHWWGPEGWSLPVCEIDFRPGGTWFYCMSGPDDMQSCGKGLYQAIKAPERLVYQDLFTDGEGNPMEGMPVAEITIEFTETDGKTLVKNLVRYPTKQDRDAVLEMGVEAGIDETWNRLEAYLASLT
jgi:uncharacterized protein YndB with AHSA1/START domain